MSDGTAERVGMTRPSPMLQYVFSAIVLFLALFGSHLATPLYPIWQARFDLTNSDIVMIFACYPIGVTFGLLHGGRLGDQLGRKPMVRSGLFLILLASLGYLVAKSMTPLLVARLLNGYGIGLLSGPAVASIIELHPRLDRGAASRVGAVATLSAPAAGMLTATLVVYFAATETAVLLPYLIFASLLVVSLGLTWGYRETILPIARRSLRKASYRPQAMRVPADIRGPFIYAACLAVLCWANTGLWLSLGPSMFFTLMTDAHPLVGGLSVVAFLGTAGVIQLTGGWLGYIRATLVSLVLVVVALVAVLVALKTESVAGVAIGLLVGGMSQGLGWMGTVELINRIAPDTMRASVLSMLYMCSYFGSIVPVLITGFAADRFGLFPALFGMCSVSIAAACILFIVTVKLRRSLPQGA